MYYTKQIFKLANKFQDDYDVGSESTQQEPSIQEAGGEEIVRGEDVLDRVNAALSAINDSDSDSGFALVLADDAFGRRNSRVLHFDTIDEAKAFIINELNEYIKCAKKGTWHAIVYMALCSNPGERKRWYPYYNLDNTVFDLQDYAPHTQYSITLDNTIKMSPEQAARNSDTMQNLFNWKSRLGKSY